MKSATYLEVAVEVREDDGDQSVESVEIELQHRQLRVKERAQLKNVDHLAHHGEGEGLLL